MARTGSDKWKVNPGGSMVPWKWGLLVACVALSVTAVMGQDARYRNVGRNNPDEKIPYNQ